MDRDNTQHICIEDAPRHDDMPFYSAVFNLANTIIGSGALTMPFIFAQCGWFGGNLIAVAIVVLTTYSVYLLVVASDRAGGIGARSFESLGYKTCGIYGSLYAQITFLVGGLGTLTGYMIFIGKLMAQVIGIGQEKAFVPIITSLIFIILPLTLQRSINRLRYVSLLALVAIICVATMYFVFFWCIGAYVDDPSAKYVYDEPRSFALNAQTPVAINLIIGAFCVQNTCLRVYSELRQRTPRKIVSATLCAMVVSFCVYELIGISGYILLGGNVQGNSLLNYDDSFVNVHRWTSAPLKAAKTSMSLLIALSVRLAIWPCRSALCSVIAQQRDGWNSPARGSDDASDHLFRVTTVCILVVVGLLSIWIPDVTIPLGIVNSLAGGSMIFIMPGLFYIGALRFNGNDGDEQLVNAPLNVPSTPRWPALVMIGVGLLVCVLGFGLEVRSIIMKYAG